MPANHNIYSLLEKNNVWLAPMAGFTDRAFRMICKEQGCGLTCTEMVSAKGLHYGGERTKELISIDEIEAPAAVQIFGSEPRIMAEQAAWICEKFHDKVALIDINMGCPAPKITSNGEGSSLMRTPSLAFDIVKSVTKSVELPVTVKFRKGWDENSANAVEFALMMQDAGASAVTIHGRTRMQFYCGNADWDCIAAVKDALDIPVIGNGDIFSASDAKKMLDYCKVDGLLVARGAQGNPWIFAEIAALLNDGVLLPAPSYAQRVELALRHAKLLLSFKSQRAIVEMRKHIACYISGMPGAAAMRNQVNQIDSIQALEELLIMNTNASENSRN